MTVYAPPAAKPAGTKEEVEAYGLDLAVIGSCSDPGPGNSGCPHRGVCRFHEIRGTNRAPENVIVDVILPGGVSNTVVVPCFDFYGGGLATRYENQATSGEKIAFLGFADTFQGQILVKGSRKRHKTMVPNCEGCQRGQCVLRDEFEEAQDPPRFERLDKTASHAIHTQERKERMLRTLQQDRLATGLGEAISPLPIEEPVRKVKPRGS